MSYIVLNKTGSRLCANTLQSVNLACSWVRVSDLSDAPDFEPVEMFLHDFFAANADAFSPYDACMLISNLLRNGYVTLEPAMGQKYELRLVELYPESDEWNFDPVVFDDEVDAQQERTISAH